VGLTRRERVEEIMRRLSIAAPFKNDVQARTSLEEIMRAVEDEYSGIQENPNAHLAARTDGRMYPPHDRFAFPSGSPRIRAFGQTGHRTYFGDNGAVLIERRLDGVAEVDLPGTDGKTIADLRSEMKNATN
jgi:hypothetical protein